MATFTPVYLTEADRCNLNLAGRLCSCKFDTEEEALAACGPVTVCTGCEVARTLYVRYSGMLASWGLVPYEHGVGSGFADEDYAKAGAKIVQTAKEVFDSADMIVKGAYTQSRLRQMIFGGLTRHLILSSPIPVLFSH